jgi:hypothetical protein
MYLQYIVFSISSVYAVYQRLGGLRTGRKGPTDLDFFHFDLVLAVRYNCHTFSITTASLQCTVLVIEHKCKQMHVLVAMAQGLMSCRPSLQC